MESSDSDADDEVDNFMDRGGDMVHNNDATELCYDAMECNSFEEKISIAKEALEISPNCIEAWNILSYCYCKGPPNIRDYNKALECVNRAISFGAYIETSIPKLNYQNISHRPYLRAIHNKVLVYEKLGLENERITTMNHLLKLCPTDPFLIRVELVTLLLMAHNYSEVERIITTYKRKSYSFFIYIKLLFVYYKYSMNPINVSSDILHKYLKKCLEFNQIIPTLLLKDKVANYKEEDDESYYSSAKPLQAAKKYVSKMNGWDVWRSVPGALQWLENECSSNRTFKPSEDELIEILNNRKIILITNNNQIISCTRNICYVPGGSGDNPPIPPTDYNDLKAGQEISYYEVTEDWENNGFRKLYYKDIKCLPFWKLYLTEIRHENLWIPCLSHLCESCHIFQPNKSKRYGDVKTENNNNNTKIKRKLKCLACQKKRFENEICEVCFKLPIENINNNNKNQKCTKCQKVYYCGRDCQRIDWKIYHKTRCGINNDNSKFLITMRTPGIIQTIVEFLVGKTNIPSIRKIINVIHLSRTAKVIHDVLLTCRIWTFLRFRVDLSMSASYMDEEDYDDYNDNERPDDYNGGDYDDGDWAWKPLKNYPSSIINSYLIYGGLYITSLSLSLRNLDTASLQIIASKCRHLSELSITFYEGNDCEFPPTAAVEEFFRHVSDLTHLSLLGDEEVTQNNLIRYFPVSVMEIIQQRQFPLQALEICVSKSTVHFITGILSNMNSINTIQTSSMSTNSNNTITATSLSSSSSSTTTSTTRKNGFGLYLQIITDTQRYTEDEEERNTVFCLNHFSHTIQQNKNIYENITNLNLHSKTLALLNDDDLEAIAKTMINLQCLDVSLLNMHHRNINPDFTDVSIIALATNCHQLKTLNLTGRTSITLKSLLMLIRNNPFLLTLDISHTSFDQTMPTINVIENILNANTSASLILLTFHVCDSVLPPTRKHSLQYYEIMKKKPKVIFKATMNGIIQFPKEKETKEIKASRKESMEFIKNMYHGDNENNVCWSTRNRHWM